MRPWLRHALQSPLQSGSVAIMTSSEDQALSSPYFENPAPYRQGLEPHCAVRTNGISWNLSEGVLKRRRRHRGLVAVYRRGPAPRAPRRSRADREIISRASQTGAELIEAGYSAYCANFRRALMTQLNSDGSFFSSGPPNLAYKKIFPGSPTHGAAKRVTTSDHGMARAVWTLDNSGPRPRQHRTQRSTSSPAASTNSPRNALCGRRLHDP